MRVFPIIRRVVTVAGGAISNRAVVKLALALTQRITINVATLKPALAIRHLVALVTPAKPALRVTQRAAGTARSTTRPALAVLPRAALLGTPTKEALDLVQIKYDLLQTKGANAQVNTGTAWTNPANATERRDGATATRAGSATVASDGTLTLDYANTVAKTALTIQSVVLKFYVSHTSTAAVSTLTLSWSKGAGATVLQTITATTNALTVPLSFTITGSITSWADLDALQTLVRWQSPAVTGATDTAACDAVECIVTATLTDAI